MINDEYLTNGHIIYYCPIVLCLLSAPGSSLIYIYLYINYINVFGTLRKHLNNFT